jgi:hypothetical protein
VFYASKLTIDIRGNDPFALQCLVRLLYVIQAVGPLRRYENSAQ